MHFDINTDEFNMTLNATELCHDFNSSVETCLNIQYL